MVGGGILAPVVIRHRIIASLWHWALTAQLAKHGVSVDDMAWIRSIPGMTKDEGAAFDKIAKRLHERHEALEARKAR